MDKTLEEALPRLLSNDATLTTLDLETYKIGNEGAIALADALKENKTLTKLHLGQNIIDNEGAKALADALKENTTLTTLNLINNVIRKEGAIALADALKKNTTFTTLNLINNKIGKKGAVALADALKENKNLTTLELGYNKIGKEGAIALADALKENTTLTTLNLKYNDIGKEGAIALADALKKNKTLTTLNLSHNGIRKEGATALADALKENKTLTKLELGYNKICNEGAIVLADALKENTSLTTLELRENGIDKECVAVLADALKENTTLTKLDLEQNYIGDEGAIAKNNIFDITRRNRVFHRHKDDIEVDGFSSYFAMSEETGKSGKLYIKESVWEAAATTDGLVLGLVHNVIRDQLDACKKDDLQSTKDELKTLLNTSRNSDGSPLLHLAAARTSVEALALAQYLVKEIGVDLDHAVTDKAGCTAREIAMAGNFETRNWAKSVGTILGRYRIEEEGRYSSGTCTVDFATDVTKSKSDPARNVAIKSMHNREQFDRELKQRLGDSLPNTSSGCDLYTKDDDGAMSENGKGSNRFDVDHVVPLLRYHIEVFEGKRYHRLIMLNFEPPSQKLDEELKNIGSTINKMDTKLDQANEKLDQANKKLDQTHKMLSEMQTELAKVSRGVNNILKDCHAPKLMYIIPEDPSIMDWIKLNALVGRKVKVIFICPVTLYIPRDGNNMPMGYSMEMPHDWVHKYGPALKISYEILRIGFALGRLAGLPLPNLSSVGSSTNVMNVLNDNLVGYMKEAPDLKELAGVLGDRVTLSLSEADENLSKHEDMRTKINVSYEEVKNIAKRNGDEDYMKTGLSKVVCDGHVEYVLDKAEIKSIYQQMGPSCLGLPQAEVEARGAELAVVMKEGYLNKETAFGWRKRYVILRRGGFLTHYESKEEWLGDLLGVMGKPKPKIVAVNRTSKSFKLTYEGGKCQSFKPNKSAVDTKAEIKNWVEKAGGGSFV